jgi:hypothetical protein
MPKRQSTTRILFRPHYPAQLTEFSASLRSKPLPPTPKLCASPPQSAKGPLQQQPISPSTAGIIRMYSRTPSSEYSVDTLDEELEEYTQYILTHWTNEVARHSGSQSPSKASSMFVRDTAVHGSQPSEQKFRANNVWDNLQRPKIISRFTSKGNFSEIFSPAISPPRVETRFAKLRHIPFKDKEWLPSFTVPRFARARLMTVRRQVEAPRLEIKHLCGDQQYDWAT